MVSVIGCCFILSSNQALIPTHCCHLFVVCCIIFSKFNCVFSLSSFLIQYTCTLCIIEFSASLTGNTVYHNNNKPGVTLLVAMATVLCLKGRNPTADPFRMDRFRLYLTRHLKIFLIYAPNLKFIFYYLLSYGCYRHTDTFFFTIWVCWLNNLMATNMSTQLRRKHKQTKGQKESWNKLKRNNKIHLKQQIRLQLHPRKTLF